MLRSQNLDRSISPLWRATSMAALAGAVVLINAACGTIATDTRAAERVAVPFESLSLDGTGLGAALAKGTSSDSPFPERVQALAGKPVAIDGYMIPLSWEGDHVAEFMLLRDNLECCMGGAPPIDHWLYAPADGSAAVPFPTGRRVRVEGNFQLVHPREWEGDGFGTGVYELRGWDVQPLE